MSCNCCHGAECPEHDGPTYKMTGASRAARLIQEAITTSALHSIADALEGMVRDADRLNSDPGENQYTELCMTGEEAAQALQIIRNILKPLPPGTMTHG